MARDAIKTIKTNSLKSVEKSHGFDKSSKMIHSTCAEYAKLYDQVSNVNVTFNSHGAHFDFHSMDLDLELDFERFVYMCVFIIAHDVLIIWTCN